MITLQLFNSKIPTAIQPLTLTPEHMANRECLIGSSPNCQVVLHSPDVSYVHGAIRFQEGGYVFSDLMSFSGTQFNDQAVTAEQPYALKADDIIRLGEFVLIVEQVEVNEQTLQASPSQNQHPRREVAKQMLAKIRHQSQAPISPQGLNGGSAAIPATLAVQTNSPKPVASNGRTAPGAKPSPKASQAVLTKLKANAPPLPLPPQEPPGQKVMTSSAPPTAAPIATTTASVPGPSLATATGMPVWQKGKITLRCAQIIPESSDVKTFRFVANPPVQFSYQPGQFVTLSLPINGKTVKRSYSISSAPSRPHTLEITVKRVPAPSNQPEIPPGLVSNWLHDNLSVGSEVTLSGPSGKFTCVSRPHHQLLLISAGSGITPMMSMSRWLLDTIAPSDIVFFHNARTPEDIIFHHELVALSAQHPQFRLAIATTRDQPGAPWSGYRGRLNDTLLKAIAPDYKERTVYVCGPNGFMKAVKSLMAEMDFPMANYYEESFGGPKGGSKPAKTASSSVAAPSNPTHLPMASPPVSAPVATPQTSPVQPQTPQATQATQATQPETQSGCVLFAQSGKEVICDGEEPILDVAEAEGIEIDSSCRSGACGTCKVKKLEGSIDYEGEPDGLDDSDQEAGYILSCIAQPRGKVVIDV